MNELNINKILNREDKANSIKDILISFEKNKNNVLIKKGIYVFFKEKYSLFLHLIEIVNNSEFT